MVLVQTDGLRRDTTRRTVLDMFRRHCTDHDRDLETVASAFHDRLAGTTMPRRTDSPRVDPLNIRRRLTAPASGGLRARLERPRLGTA